MIIRNIPESVYKRACELKDDTTKDDLPEDWSWKNEWDYLTDKAGFTESELEKAISEYLLSDEGDWSRH